MDSRTGFLIIKFVCAISYCWAQGGFPVPNEFEMFSPTTTTTTTLRPDVSIFDFYNDGLNDVTFPNDVKTTTTQRSTMNFNIGVQTNFISPAQPSTLAPPVNPPPINTPSVNTQIQPARPNQGQVESFDPPKYTPPVSTPPTHTPPVNTPLNWNTLLSSKDGCINGLYIRHEQSCSLFYKCLPNGRWTMFSCGRFHYFDLNTSGCNHKYLVRCFVRNYW